MRRVAAAALLTVAGVGVGVVTAVVLRRDGASSVAWTQQAARSGPIVLGTAFRVALTQSDPRYRAQLLSHGYGSLTPEYEMYMDSVEGTRGVFDFVQADRAVSFARVHGMAIRGHALVWGRQLPTWLTRPSTRWTRATLLPVMEQWIRTMVGHYVGAISEWDIVNEPLNENGSLKRNLWERVIGPDYIRIALQTAHTADPTALLYINDYSTEWLDRKSNALFALTRTLRRARVPLGGIGFQVHSDTRWPVVESQLEANMKRFGALGLRTDITEMDVNTSSFAGTEQAKLNAQARIYSDAAGACRTAPTCWTFTTWGFADKYTWLGAAGQPLPFAANYSAKPAWAAITAHLAK